MRTNRSTARSSAVRRQAVCQQQPACRPARCWHWSVMGHGVAELRVSTVAAATEPGGRRGGAGGAGAAVSRGASAARPPRRPSRRPARRPRAATLQLRHCPRLCRGRQRHLRQSHPPRRLPTPRRSQSQRPLQLPLLPLDLCLGVRVEPFASSVATSAVALLVVHVGVVLLRAGASQGRARPSERAAPPRPTQGRRGSRSPQRGWRRGSGPRTRLAVGRRGERRGGAAGWASEGCTAGGRGAAVAASPSLNDEVDDVGDGGAPAALPP